MNRTAAITLAFAIAFGLSSCSGTCGSTGCTTGTMSGSAPAYSGQSFTRYPGLDFLPVFSVKATSGT